MGGPGARDDGRTSTGSAKAISGLTEPRPPQTAQAPLELLENHAASTPFASAKSLRIRSMAPVKVAGVERVDVPMGL